MRLLSLITSTQSTARIGVSIWYLGSPVCPRTAISALFNTMGRLRAEGAVLNRICCPDFSCFIQRERLQQNDRKRECYTLVHAKKIDQRHLGTCMIAFYIGAYIGLACV